MREKTIFLFIASWCLCLQLVNVQGVTSGDYCDFLNETQSSCYEKEVGLNDSLMRLGQPGAYYYIALEEGSLLCGISQSDLASYEAWRGVRIIEFDEKIDPLLKINRPLRFISCEEERQEVEKPSSFNTTFASGFLFLSLLTGEGVAREEEKKIPGTTFTPEEQEELTVHLQKAIEREEDSSVVEQLLNERSENWKSHLYLCQEQIESRESLAQAEANLKQLEEKNREEHLKGELERVAKESKKGGIYLMIGRAALTVTGAFAPIRASMVMVSAFVKQGTEILTHVSQTIGEKAMQAAETQQREASEKAEEIEERGRLAEENLLEREENIQKIKEALLKEEFARTHLLAQNFVPQKLWGEHHWQQWGERYGISAGLTIKNQENGEWLHWKTAELWQNRIQKSRLALDKVRRKIKKKLTPLERKSEFLWERAKQAQEEYEKALARKEASFLEQKKKQERRDELKLIAVRALQQVSREERDTSMLNEDELLNYFTLEEKREYIAVLKWLQCFEEELQLLHENINILKTQWEAEENLARQHQPTEQQEYYDFLVQIIKSRVRADQEALRCYWPEADLEFRPYLKWELLAPQELEEQEEEFKDEEEIKAPLTLIEEIEAEGRYYWYQAQEMIKQALEEKELLKKEEQTKQQEMSNTAFSFGSLLEEPQEALCSWNLEEMKHPTEWDKKRWIARAELEQALSQAMELRSLIAFLQKEDLTIENRTTLGTEIRERELDQWTESNFEGARTASLLGAQAPLNMTLEGLRDAYDQASEQVNKKKSAWEEAVRETEINSELEKYEEDVWRKADQMILEKFLSESAIAVEKAIAKRLEENWDRNLKRWRIFKRTDDLMTEIEEKKKEREIYDLDSHEYTSLSVIIDELEKRYQDERSSWEKELDPKVITEKEKYEGKDQRVLNRWKHFVERKKGESNIDLEKSETTNSILVRTHASEVDALEDAEKETPGAKEYWEKEGGELAKLFIQEKKRLDHIEKIWESIVKAQEEALWNRCCFAARRYKVQPRLWEEELRPHERAYYNKEVERRNCEDPLAKEEEELREIKDTLQKKKEDLEKRKSHIEEEIAEEVTMLGNLFGAHESYYLRKQFLEEKLQELVTSSEYEGYEQRLEALQKRKEERQKFCDFGNKSEQERREFIEKEIVRKKSEYRISLDRKRANDCSNRAKMTKQEEVAKIFGGYDERNPGAAWAYEQAAEAELKWNAQAAQLYRQCGEAYEKQAESLEQGNEIEASTQGAIAEALRAAVQAHREAAIAQLKSEFQAAQLARKKGQTYEKQADALTKAAEAELRGNTQAAKLYRQCGEAYEKQVMALEKGDEAAVHQQEKMAKELNKIAWACMEAVEAGLKENVRLTKLHGLCREAYEKAAEALSF